VKKLKWLVLLVVMGVVVYFFTENWRLVEPITLFGFELLHLPTSLIILSCLIIGFGTGWLGHYWRHNRRRPPSIETVSHAEPTGQSSTQQSHPQNQG
jgi:hypothetical protein